MESFGNKVGLRPQDLYDIASGEVVIAWLPFEKDKRRPFAICVVADIRGLRAKADEAIAKIDSDLKLGGWERVDVGSSRSNRPALQQQAQAGPVEGRADRDLRR